MRGAIQRKGELKFVDVLTTVQNFYAARPPDPLPVYPITGATETTRIGRKIMMKSLHFTGYVTQTQQANAVPNEFLRCLIVYDRQPNAALPALADVIQSTDNAAATASTARDMLNMSNAERFKVLRDWRISIGGPDNTLGLTEPSRQVLQVNPPGTKDGPFGMVIEAFIKLNGLEMHFNNGNAGTIADITTGSIFLITLGLQANNLTPYSLTYTCRLRYWDH